MMASVGNLKDGEDLDAEMEIAEDTVGEKGEGLLPSKMLEEMQQRKGE